MLMAEAGYHPQFALILGRYLNYYLNTPRYATFFSSHPDWASREKRLQEVYQPALAIFESRWPDNANSPGGKLPALGSIGKVVTSEDGKAVVFHVPVRLVNPDAKPVRVAVTLLENNRRVASALPEYRSTDGSLIVNSDLPGSTNDADDIQLRLPLAAIATPSRRLKAVVYLATGNETIAVAEAKVALPEE
jgi:hypothetical protein